MFIHRLRCKHDTNIVSLWKLWKILYFDISMKMYANYVGSKFSMLSRFVPSLRRIILRCSLAKCVLGVLWIDWINLSTPIKIVFMLLVKLSMHATRIYSISINNSFIFIMAFSIFVDCFFQIFFSFQFLLFLDSQKTCHPTKSMWAHSAARVIYPICN